LARRFGRSNEKKAAVAVAHTLICIAWAVMNYDGGYTEAGADYYESRDQRNHEHIVRRRQQAVARLGYQVTLTSPGDGTMRSDRARTSLDRHATYIVAAYVAGAAR
jgi:hypothetical protein